jgi:hypothetical protein
MGKTWENLEKTGENHGKNHGKCCLMWKSWETLRSKWRFLDGIIRNQRGQFPGTFDYQKVETVVLVMSQKRFWLVDETRLQPPKVVWFKKHKVQLVDPTWIYRWVSSPQIQLITKWTKWINPSLGGRSLLD